MEEKLTEVLAWIEKGVIWTAEQSPLAVQELFKWKIAEYWFWVLFGVMFLVLGFALLTIWKKAKKDLKPYDYDDVCGWIIGASFSWAVGLTIILCHAYYLIQISVAPRIWLIEYIGRVVG